MPQEAASESQEAQRVVMRTTPGQYALWGALLGIVVLLGYSAGSFDVRSNPSKWIGVLLLAGAWSAIFSWWSYFKIEIAGDQVSYRSPFKGSISVARQDVVGYKLYEERLNSSGAIPRHAIVIRTRTGRDIEINTKPFSKPDIDTVLRFLN
jgi:hypothetical protein